MDKAELKDLGLTPEEFSSLEFTIPDIHIRLRFKVQPPELTIAEVIALGKNFVEDYCKQKGLPTGVGKFSAEKSKGYWMVEKKMTVSFARSEKWDPVTDSNKRSELFEEGIISVSKTKPSVQ